jgi:hypothetical protein
VATVRGLISNSFDPAERHGREQIVEKVLFDLAGYKKRESVIGFFGKCKYERFL